MLSENEIRNLHTFNWDEDGDLIVHPSNPKTVKKLALTAILNKKKIGSIAWALMALGYSEECYYAFLDYAENAPKNESDLLKELRECDI